MVSAPPPERAPVTRAAIVDVALTLLGDGGLEAVSFRRIAGCLGVSAPTLYWHVESKRQLMDLMAEELLRRAGATPAPAGTGEPWWAWLRGSAVRMFEALVTTRDAPRVLAGNRPGRESFGQLEQVVAVLVDAGLPPVDAHRALSAIGAYVLGSATEWQAEAERGSVPRPTAAEGEAAVRALAPAHHPVLLDPVTGLPAQPHEATFEFGLDLLIDGLRARVAHQD